MNDRDQRRYERGSRVKTFCETNAGDFAAGSLMHQHTAGVVSLFGRIDGAKAEQAPARVSKETLLDALRLDLLNISRAAQAIALKENGFAAPHVLPAEVTERAMTTHADAVLLRLEDQEADAAAVKTAQAALRAKFVARELPAEFVANLRADRQAITDANTLNNEETQEGTGATSLIGTLLKELNDEVTQLDAMMHNKYARVPDKLRTWLSASHVERAAHREKKPAPPAPQPPAA